MMLLLILSGALIAGIFLQGFEFALLGAFLGFLLGRINQLSKNAMQLNRQLSELKQQLNTAIAFTKDSVDPKRASTEQQASHTSLEQTPPVQQSSERQYNGQKLETKESLQSSNATHSVAKSHQSEANAVSSSEPGTDRLPSEEPAQAPPWPERHDSSRQRIKNGHRTTPSQDIVSKAIKLVSNYFTQGNVVVRVGAVILFFGVAFLLKYAAENSNISMQTRLIGVAIGAIALLIFGWKLKDKQQGYGLILQGASVGILYLTLFAAFRLYDMVPAGLAFALLFLFSALAMALAVLQNSKALAILSVSGGFLAPILTSTGTGSHTALFGYYAILNIGIFAVAWFRSWRLLNLIGFVFTFLIGTAWGVTKYQPSDFSTTEPFLILFFLLYSAIAVLFSSQQKPQLKGYMDATLIFALPLVSFALQAAMVQEIEFALAWSAFALGAFYLTAASIILKGKNDFIKVIAEAYLALGIIFVSLVIPFALDGQWTAASWAIEGAGLVWIGLKQRRWFAKYFGTLIQFSGGFFFLTEINLKDSRLFDAEMLGIVFVAASALFSSYQIWGRKNELKSFEANSHFLFLGWGMLWWYLGGSVQVIDNLSSGERYNGLIALFSLSGLLWYVIEIRFQWTILRQLTWLTLVISIITALGASTAASHLLVFPNGLFWLAAVVLFYGCLYHREKIGNSAPSPNESANDKGQNKTVSMLPIASNILHFVALIALVLLSFHEIHWLITNFELTNSSWGVAIYGILVGFWLMILRKDFIWPMTDYPKTYSVAAASLLLVMAIFWSLLGNFPNSGVASPLVYLPILNPLDIVQGLLLLIVFGSVKKVAKYGIKTNQQTLKIITVFFVFGWLNVILFRSIHAWLGVPYEIDDLLNSFLVQTSLSIFWTVIGLTGTIYGARIGSRKIWIYAASLLGIVVLKLFLVDLDNSSSIERIVSFVVVGLLLLIVGYFSPLPTANDLSSDKAEEGDKNEN